MGIEETFVMCVCGMLMQDSDLPQHFAEFLKKELGQQAITLKIRSHDIGIEHVVCIRCGRSIGESKSTLISFYPDKYKPSLNRREEEATNAHIDVVRKHYQHQVEKNDRENGVGACNSKARQSGAASSRQEETSLRPVRFSFRMQNFDNAEQQIPKDASTATEKDQSKKAIFADRDVDMVSENVRLSENLHSVPSDDITKHKQTQTEGSAESICSVDQIIANAKTRPQRLWEEQPSRQARLSENIDSDVKQIAVVSYDAREYTDMQRDDIKNHHQQIQVEGYAGNTANAIQNPDAKSTSWEKQSSKPVRPSEAFDNELEQIPNGSQRESDSEKDPVAETIRPDCVNVVSYDDQESLILHSEDARKCLQVQPYSCVANSGNAAQNLNPGSSSRHKEQASMSVRPPEVLVNDLQQITTNEPREDASESAPSRKAPCTDCHVAVVPSRARAYAETPEDEQNYDLVVQVLNRSDRMVHQGTQTELSTGLDVGVQVKVTGAYPLEMGEFERLIASREGSDDDGSAPQVDPIAEAAYKRHQSNLIPCRHCSRTFSPGRVQKHESCCIDRPRSGIRDCITPADGEIPR